MNAKLRLTLGFLSFVFSLSFALSKNLQITKVCKPLTAQNIHPVNASIPERVHAVALYFAKNPFTLTNGKLSTSFQTRGLICRGEGGEWNSYLPSNEDIVQLSRWHGITREADSINYNSKGAATLSLNLKDALTDCEKKDLAEGKQIRVRFQVLHKSVGYITIDSLNMFAGRIYPYAGQDFLLTIQNDTILAVKRLKNTLADVPVKKPIKN